MVCQIRMEILEANLSPLSQYHCRLLRIGTLLYACRGPASRLSGSEHIGRNGALTIFDGQRWLLNLSDGEEFHPDYYDGNIWTSLRPVAPQPTKRHHCSFPRLSLFSAVIEIVFYTDPQAPSRRRTCACLHWPFLKPTILHCQPINPASLLSHRIDCLLVIIIASFPGPSSCMHRREGPGWTFSDQKHLSKPG
jgi:hypothetical protein